MTKPRKELRRFACLCCHGVFLSKYARKTHPCKGAPDEPIVAVAA